MLTGSARNGGEGLLLRLAAEWWAKDIGDIDSVADSDIVFGAVLDDSDGRGASFLVRPSWSIRFLRSFCRSPISSHQPWPRDNEQHPIRYARCAALFCSWRAAVMTLFLGLSA